MGVIILYIGVSRIIDEVGKYDYDEIVDFVWDGGKIRFIGYNIKIYVGVKYECFNYYSNMFNWFVFVIII